MTSVEGEKTSVCLLNDVDRRAGFISPERNVADDLIKILSEDLCANVSHSGNSETAVDFGHVPDIRSD